MYLFIISISYISRFLREMFLCIHIFLYLFSYTHVLPSNFTQVSLVLSDCRHVRVDLYLNSFVLYSVDHVLYHLFHFQRLSSHSHRPSIPCISHLSFHVHFHLSHTSSAHFHFCLRFLLNILSLVDFQGMLFS